VSLPHGPLRERTFETEHWEDARHWMSIYDDLIRFKLGLFRTGQARTAQTPPGGPEAAIVDVTFIEAQMAGYYDASTFGTSGSGTSRVCGLIPRVGSCATRGRRRWLTNREFELLQFLLDHPSPLLTPRHRSWDMRGQILPCSQKKSATTVSRVRKILTRLEIPCDLVNRPGRGYYPDVSEHGLAQWVQPDAPPRSGQSGVFYFVRYGDPLVGVSDCYDRRCGPRRSS